MQKVNLTKYGFVRTPNEDFSDDGNRFYVYHAGRVRVSKCTWSGQIFLAGRIDDGRVLGYDEYSKLPHYKGLDRLNGVSISSITENDLIQLYNDCIEYEKEYTEAEKNVSFPTIEELREQCLKIRAHYQGQLDEATKLIQENAIKLFFSEKYCVREIKSFYNTIKSRAEGYDPDRYPQSIQKSVYGRDFVKPTNHDLTDTWYLDHIKKDIAEAIA
jgi:hypothetical protein